MDALRPFVFRREQRNPAIEERHLNGVIGQVQLQMIILHQITSLFVTVNAAEVEQVLSVYNTATTSTGILDPAAGFPR